MAFGMANLIGADGSRVNAIAPGLVEKRAISAMLTAETRARIHSVQLLTADGVAEDVVRLALFGTSDEARFITCVIVSFDAGNRRRGGRR